MFEFVPVVIRNALSKPATRNYPKVIRVPFEKQKGHIQIDIQSCIFCGLCSRKCPVGSIKVSRPEKTWTIDPFKCIVCGACVEGCPKKCLKMSPEYTKPASAKSENTFTLPVEKKEENDRA